MMRNFAWIGCNRKLFHKQKQDDRNILVIFRQVYVVRFKDRRRACTRDRREQRYGGCPVWNFEELCKTTKRDNLVVDSLIYS